MTSVRKVDAEPSKARMRGRVREVSLPMLSAPYPDGFTEHVAPDGRRVFVSETVIEALVRLERAHHPDETAGLLFGRYFTDGRNRCTIVTDLVPPEDGEVEGTRSTVTITAAGARRMRARARRRVPWADPVGWGHTHPTFPPFFSGTDRAEQRLWTEPTSVGIVLSGTRDAAELYHVYVGPDSALAEAAAPHSKPVPTPAAFAPTPQTKESGMMQVRLPRRPSRRPWGAVVYGVGLGALMIAAFALALLGWRTAASARHAAQRVEAQTAAVSRLTAMTRVRARSGESTAQRALRKAGRASRAAARTERRLHLLKARTEGAAKAATDASALGMRAIEQSQAALASVEAMRAAVEEIRAAEARTSHVTAPGTSKPARASSAAAPGSAR